MARLLLAVVVLSSLVGCSGGPAPSGPHDSTDPVPDNAVPCDLPENWPYSFASKDHPFLVHYREARDADQAERVAGLLDTSWTAEVDGLGFTAPLADPGKCGPDDRFDVFLWRGHGDAYVDVLGGNPATPWNDQFAFMVVDAWGPYAGSILDTTVAHEFNHACQAADDWHDAAIIYEMTSQFVEDQVFDGDNEYAGLFGDFQARPDWSLDRDDGYATWYMYGASMYLFYVRDRFYGGDASFVADMWHGMRNPPGANEPDFEDALDVLLGEAAGASYQGSVGEFARWRWYTGARDDGAHFEEGATFPASAKVKSRVVEAPTAAAFDVVPAPMMLGSAYLDVRAPAGTVDLAVTLDASDPSVRWLVQAVPGLDAGTDGDTLDLAAGDRLRLSPDGTRTLILSAMPTGSSDPDKRTDERFPVSVTLAP